MVSATVGIEEMDRARFERAERTFVTTLIAFLKGPVSEKLRKEVIRAGTDEMRSHPAETKTLLPWLNDLAVRDRAAWSELLINAYRRSPHLGVTIALQREIDTLKSLSPFHGLRILVFTYVRPGVVDFVNGDPIDRQRFAEARDFWTYDSKWDNTAVLMAVPP